MISPRFKIPVLLLAAAFAVGIFALDLSIELGVAAAVSYVLVVWLAYFAGSRLGVQTAAVACSLLAVAGLFLSPSGGELGKVLANRSLALLVIWVTSALCLHILKLLAQQAERVETAEESIADMTQKREDDAIKRRVMASVMEDLELERAALKREIQARQEVQEMLQASEQRFFSIIESAPTAMVMIDRRGRIVLVNSETESLFHYNREELLDQPIEILVPERFHEQHPGYRNEFFAHPEARRMGTSRDLFAMRKGGGEFPVEIGLNPIETKDGVFVLSAIVDITERKLAEEEIRRINQELRRKNDEMQQFVYTVSHDLKSPLVTCKGFVGLMKEDVREQRWDDMLDSATRVERATERMGELIEDLLQLSRIGVIRNDPEKIDVGRVVHAISDDLAARFADAGATLTVQEQLPSVVADRVRLTQVFENLLSNALKYGCRADSPEVVVGGEQRNGKVVYFVQDNGPGIAQEFQKKVFGLFQRLGSDKEGTGVGLAAVARIMEVHGGDVGVESSPGRGAKFWVSFPTREPPE